MASDWIKMRTDIYRDPKVCIIADLLMEPAGDLARYVSQNCGRDMTVTRNVMRNVTVGALVTLWGVTRNRGKRDNDDLLLRGATLSVIDDITELPGLGEALFQVGWAVETEAGVVLPDFYKTYNVEPNCDSKEKNAERQRRYREKRNALRNVTVAQQSNARIEKSREEKSNTNTYVSSGDDTAVEEVQEQTPNRKPATYSEAFERFWNVFPKIRRTAKGQAWKAWKTASKLVDQETLIQRASEYASSPVGKSEFAKMPSSWLNGRCWEDDPSAWQRYGNNGQHRFSQPQQESIYKPLEPISSLRRKPINQQ